MKSFIVIGLLVCTIVGCGEPREREDRPHRRRHRDEIVEPVVKKIEGIASAQQEQIKARAQGMRELAAQARNGTIKTLWDASKAYRGFDAASRTAFDTAIAERLQGDLGGGSDDNLKSNAAEVFEKVAEELESLLK